MKRKEMGEWLEHYRCGCTNVTKLKKDLPGYCPTHGEDRLEPIIKLSGSVEVGLSR